MEPRLSLEVLPTISYATFRYFEKHEHHVTRIYNWNVLVMVFEGVLRFHEAGKLIEVNAGEYYIQRKQIFQEGLVESDEPKYFLIHWPDGEYDYKESSLPLKGKVNFAELFPVLRELDTMIITGATQVEKSALFYRILSSLKKSGAQKKSSEAVAKVISHVTEDIRKPVSLDEVAAKCGYSKNHIISIFKKETGKTPYAYITDIKIGMVKQLLLNSDSSLSSISVECGFGSYINMYRAFLNSEGCSPADWKNTHRT